MRGARFTACLVIAALLLGGAPLPEARGAVFWNLGVLENPILLCFVGNALKARPDRVEQVLHYVKEFEYAANIEFHYIGACPPAVSQPDGRDFYNGDIRVIIPGLDVSGTVRVPGKGCTIGGEQTWGSWANPPSALADQRGCAYNLKLGDDPWDGVPYLNHALHEFGHALGFAHEHIRLDATCHVTPDDRWAANPPPGTRGSGLVLVTPYDADSVMHYAIVLDGERCSDGNYAHTGLSRWDKLALKFFYPEDGYPAPIVGRTLIRQGESLSLQSAWLAHGIDVEYVARDFEWRIDGATVSTSPRLEMIADQAGTFELTFSYRDLLGRVHRSSTVLRVLPGAGDPGR